MARFSRQLCLLAAALTLAGLAAAAGRSDPGPTFTGQATALSGSLAGLAVGPFGDTGLQQGSSFSAHNSLVSTPGLAGVSADVLHGTTIAGGDQVNSEASLADVGVAEPGLSVSAAFLMARANATCTSSGPTVTGSSELVDLALNGQPVTITGAPNQEIDVPMVGSIIINQQTQTTSPTSASIRVNALHVHLLGGDDLVFSSAYAEVDACSLNPPPSPSVCPDKDFTTGGGFVTVNGDKGQFVIAAGVRSNTDGWGHTHFRGNGVTVDATTIKDYSTPTNGVGRTWDGLATVNGSGTHPYKVTAIDNGEPGRSDRFTLVVDGATIADGTLAGGNIQLHCKS
jgi:hypothetical protein